MPSKSLIHSTSRNEPLYRLASDRPVHLPDNCKEYLRGYGPHLQHVGTCNKGFPTSSTPCLRGCPTVPGFPKTVSCGLNCTRSDRISSDGRRCTTSRRQEKEVIVELELTASQSSILETPSVNLVTVQDILSRIPPIKTVLRIAPP